MDPTASNFNSGYTVMLAGLCTFFGCTDVTNRNYNALATFPSAAVFPSTVIKAICDSAITDGRRTVS